MPRAKRPKNPELPTKPKYAIALSFAGPDRTFAESIADGLKTFGVRVFYDKYEQHELWGHDLHETLQRVYVKECRHCVLILTPSYLASMWPIFERQQIIDRLAHEHGSDCVLPVRVDGFKETLPGLSDGIAYLAVSSSQAQFVVSMILRKLGEPGYEISSSEAYARALRMIHLRQRGFLSYHKIYTSTELLAREYQSFLGVNDILNWLGHTFAWRRKLGGPLEIMGANHSPEKLDKEDFSVICRFEAPESWIGCGRWQLLPPNDMDIDNVDDNTELVIALYLYSPDPEEHLALLDGEAEAAFMAAVVLKGEEIDRFYRLAEQNYDDIR